MPTFIKRCALMICLAALTMPRVRADETLTVTVKEDGNVYTETIYVKGEWARIEHINRDHTARIVRCDLRKAFTVNLDEGTYSEGKLVSWPSEQEIWQRARSSIISGIHRPEATGKQPVIQVVDTGERKTVFGREARRIVTTATYNELPAIKGQYGARVVRDVTEAWYIHFPLRTRCEPMMLFRAVPFEEINGNIKLNASAYPVELVRTQVVEINGADGTRREITNKFERTLSGIAGSTLDPSLFVVPNGFRKISRARNGAR
jgi:hypothetical protein